MVLVVEIYYEQQINDAVGSRRLGRRNHQICGSEAKWSPEEFK